MLDITDWVFRNFTDPKQYGYPQTDWSVDCPYCHNRGHSEDTGHHLNISIVKQSVHCFRCGYSGSWINLVMKFSGLPYHTALAELYVIPKIKDFKTIGNTETVKVEDTKPNLPKGFINLCDADDSYHTYKRYMMNRGFGADYWSQYNIGVASSIQGRVIIPIEDDYWQGRSIYKWMEPKYINPKSKARHYIFNSPALQKYDEIVICEGAFSAMAVGANAVAMIGKEIPDEKLYRLQSSAASNFIIALELNAWQTVHALAEGLYAAGKNVTIWKYTVGDPADPVNDFVVMEYNMMTRVKLSMGM